MKYIISTGHTPSGTTGCGAVDLIDESNCTREVSKLVVEKLRYLGHTVVLLQINKGNSYNCEDCYNRVNEANNIGGDLFIEIHFNSGIGRRGDGCEVLTRSNSQLARSSADNICKELSSALNITNRGVKNQSVIVLSKTNMPAILVECMFVDGENADMRYNAEIIASAIVKGLTGCDTNSKYVVGWNCNETGYWYSPDGQNYYADCWKQIKGTDGLDYYYKFDSDGYMYSNHWFFEDNKWYYVDNGGGMIQARLPEIVKWQWIDGKCYCFGTDGVLYQDYITYDGYRVLKDGSWDGNGK